MKRPVAILYLFVILLQATSTLWILGSFYMSRDYISQNVCINRFDAIPVCRGQCYLDKELKKNDRQEQEFPNLKQKDMQWFFQEKETYKTTGFVCVHEPAMPRYPAVFYNSKFHPRIFHPPQAA